ncbi:hypothetical protein Tco_1266129 [Tanacetum coccineum]
MVACLERTDGNVDFHEIVNFLTTSPIHYALTVSPTIYASYIEQFWNTAHSQTVNDVKQIHATVDGKTVVISESSVRSDLHFNDEDGITCLTNETIFENLVLMGYESDSDKLTFQKALFFPQWKYLIHTILHCLSSKSTSWNEFSTNIASAVICLANGENFNFSKQIFDGMLRNLDTNTKKFLMYPRFLQLFLNNQISLVELFDDIYKTPVHTKKVFTNMKRKGKYFSGRITPLFASMLAPPVVEGEGSGQPTEPQPAPSTTQPIIEEQIPTSVPIPNVADEADFKEWDDRVLRATTTAASLDAAQASGNISKTQSTTMSNEPLTQEIGSTDRPRCQESMGGVTAQTRGYTPGSDEGRPDLHELMAICTKLFDMVDSSDDSLGEENASKQGRNDSNKTEEFNLSDKGSGGTEVFDDTTAACIHEVIPQISFRCYIVKMGVLHIPDIDTAGPLNVSAAGPSTSTAGDIFEDEMMTIADTLVAIRSTRPRTNSVVIHDVEEEPRRATLVPIVQSQDKGKSKIVEPEPTPKNPINAQIQMDEEIAQRLFEEDQAQFEREQMISRERAAKQEAKDAALIAEFDNVQARMKADALLAARLQEEEREQFSIDEQA